MVSEHSQKEDNQRPNLKLIEAGGVLPLISISIRKDLEGATQFRASIIIYPSIFAVWKESTFSVCLGPLQQLVKSVLF